MYLFLTTNNIFVFSTPQLRSHGGEDLIVTPFAQILASLRQVRNNFLSLTNVSSAKYAILCKIHYMALITFDFVCFVWIRSKRAAATPLQKPILPGDEQYLRLAGDTMEELEWCLDQLETIQTHRSVSDMASLKVGLICLEESTFGVIQCKKEYFLKWPILSV